MQTFARYTPTFADACCRYESTVATLRSSVRVLKDQIQSATIATQDAARAMAGGFPAYGGFGYGSPHGAGGRGMQEQEEVGGSFGPGGLGLDLVAFGSWVSCVMC